MDWNIQCICEYYSMLLTIYWMYTKCTAVKIKISIIRKNYTYCTCKYNTIVCTHCTYSSLYKVHYILLLAQITRHSNIILYIMLLILIIRSLTAVEYSKCVVKLISLSLFTDLLGVPQCAFKTHRHKSH